MPVNVLIPAFVTASLVKGTGSKLFDGLLKSDSFRDNFGLIGSGGDFIGAIKVSLVTVGNLDDSGSTMEEAICELANSVGAAVENLVVSAISEL